MSADRPNWLRRGLLWGVPAIALAAAIGFVLAPIRSVSTDDAYVKAEKTLVAPDVDGVVLEKLVRENESVAAGQPVLRLDAREAALAVAEAEARLGAVRRDFASLRAQRAELQAELDSARRDAAFARRELARQRELAASKLVAASRLDDAEHAVDVADGRTAVLERQLDAIAARLGLPAATSVEATPDFLAAAAALERARLDVERALIRAPRAGIASRLPQVGDRLKAGTAAFALVDDARPWVEANFKETELGLLQPGQAVRLEVDAYPGRAWVGRVESIAQATGAEFALLPAQNATGNWVKVVQRVPVRIDVVRAPGDPPLRSGMSVTATVDVRPAGPAVAAARGG
jgi:membrane fusion protein (multidrug efflux system)